MPARAYRTYRDFFPYYLTEHARPQTRWLHYCGTTVELGSLAAALLTGNGWWLIPAVLGGYGFAWIGHFFVEKNRPATFTYPLWSWIADHHMVWLALTGRLGERLRRAEARLVRQRTPDVQDD